MCGIAGGYSEITTSSQAKRLKNNLAMLLKLSSLRGKDASGLQLFSGKNSVLITQDGPAENLIGGEKFADLPVDNHTGRNAFIIHCRLATNGSVDIKQNQQPQNWPDFSGVHNGIITAINNEPLESGKDVTYSDSYRFFERLQKEIDSESDEPAEALRRLLESVTGEANIALYFPLKKKFVLATNTGSIFYFFDASKKLFYFLSEKNQLKEFLSSNPSTNTKTSIASIRQLKAGEILLVSTTDFSATVSEFNYLDKNFHQGPSSHHKVQKAVYPAVLAELPNLKRCTKCILPETYPLISFNEAGVCNFCLRYEKQVQHGENALLNYLEKYRSRDGSIDCLVGLSGGRDSSYGLHLLKRKYGMNPVTYSYDWGLTTDISRRNQSLMCSQLGVEHIIRSANLTRKRYYIQKNVHAFLKRPHLGMVPIFMSGDKEFYEYGRTLKKEVDVSLTVFCGGHSLEQRDFFTGFCGVDENIANNKRLFHFTMRNKIKLALFYASQYALNPAYFNESFLESVRSFLYSFIYRDDFLYLYEYIPWNETEIEETLATYGWQSDTAYGKNQWRMGDGQTGFTNYIFKAVAGFTEFDNYRSNQIREGMISRDEALKSLADDNRTKEESLKYFAEVVGIDLNSVLKKIDQIPKLYT
jgi:predicted glutamine amidotransferase